MNYQATSLDEFLDRVATLPAIEQLEELKLRRERHLAELGMLREQVHDLTLKGGNTKQLRAANEAIAIVNTDIARLKEAIKETNIRMERVTWAKAVTAIYGQEGYERCRIWMIQNDPERFSNFKGMDRLLAHYGIRLESGHA